MSFVENSVTRTLQFPVSLIYVILSDFREHHLRIAPSSVRPTSYRLIAGGVGHGTIVEFATSIGHEPSPAQFVIDETIPGREFTLSTTNGAIVQSFVLSEDGPDRCAVQFSIRYRHRPGLLGLFDRVVGPMEIERILSQKMNNLELYAATLGTTYTGSASTELISV